MLVFVCSVSFAVARRGLLLFVVDWCDVVAVLGFVVRCCCLVSDVW